MTFTRVWSSDDGKEPGMPEKPVVTASTPLDVICHDGRTFEIPAPMLRYLEDKPLNIRASNAIALKNGMMDMKYDGAYGCVYCQHYAQNLQVLMNQPESTVKGDYGGTPGIRVRGCSYRGASTRHATWFTGRDGKHVQAWRTQCVVDDAAMQALVAKGELDEYEVKGQEYTLPSLAELILQNETPKKFKAVGPVPPSKESIWSWAIDALRKYLPA